MKTRVLEQIEVCRVVAVVRLDDLSRAVDLAQALLAGGIRIIEFTLTNPDAVKAIAAVNNALDGQCLVGAGSVIDTDGVDAVNAAGAAFVVSPVMLPTVIERCHAHGLPVMPGAYTPTEIQTAWLLGASAVKVFPARDLGANYIRDVLAPMPHLRLMPTGGINAQNAGDYIRAGALAVGVGGRLVDAELIAAANWDAITQRAAELITAVRNA